MAVKDLMNLDKIQKDINNVFEKFNENVFGNYKRPAINISQNSSFVVINVEMNGLDKDDIILTIHHNSLEVYGEKKKKTLKRDSEESTYKGYKAIIGLPILVDIDNIKAEYRNSNLKITVPKMKTKIGSRVDIK